jgi:hypothetical protein
MILDYGKRKKTSVRSCFAVGESSEEQNSLTDVGQITSESDQPVMGTLAGES